MKVGFVELQLYKRFFEAGYVIVGYTVLNCAKVPLIGNFAVLNHSFGLLEGHVVNKLQFLLLSGYVGNHRGQGWEQLGLYCFVCVVHVKTAAGETVVGPYPVGFVH